MSEKLKKLRNTKGYENLKEILGDELGTLIYDVINELQPCSDIGMKNYKKIRKEKKMTLREVEKVTGISNAYLSQLENGFIKKPSHDTIMKLNDIYGRHEIVMPLRIQRSRKIKQVSPNGLPIVYVGRPTKYGNPFKLNQVISSEDIGISKREPTQITLDTVSKVLLAYKFWLDNSEEGENVKVLAKRDLKNKNISCWCPVTCECHADVLLELVKW